MDLHYRRPPDDTRIFTQELLLDRDDVKVTLARDVRFESPVKVRDEVVLESGADAVWFTFPGEWHDIGRFHLRNDTFTGIYSNIVTPPVFIPFGSRGDRPEDERDRSSGRSIWTTTDLFLDVWIPKEGGLLVLDRDQLEEAVEKEWVSPEVARRALDEVEAVRTAHAGGEWPPPVVEAWPLERAREASRTGPT